MHTDQSFKDALKYIAAAKTSKECIRRQKVHGIKGESILVSLPGFSWTRSLPHDFMHLMFENIIPSMVKFWSGHFKGLDEGSGDYELPPKIWMIGEETAAASSTIPTCFVSALSNVAKDGGLFKAETWSFWYIYLMPHLLKGRLSERYYQHAILLVDIIKTCLQFSITTTEIDNLKEIIIQWVEKYEQ